MIKSLYTLVYFREGEKLGNGPIPLDPRKREKEQIQVEEHIVAESLQDAMCYWQAELLDEGVDFKSITKQVPVVDVPPLPDRGPFEKPKPEDAKCKSKSRAESDVNTGLPWTGGPADTDEARATSMDRAFFESMSPPMIENPSMPLQQHPPAGDITALMLVIGSDGIITSGYCVMGWSTASFVSIPANLIVWLQRPTAKLRALAEDKMKTFPHSRIINAYPKNK